MNETNNEYHQTQRHDDEIDLAELFLVLWKRKIMIAAVTILATIAALVVTMALPEIYEITAIVEPGRDAEGQLVEDPQEIQGKIVNGAYNGTLAKKHKLASDQIPAFQASVPKNTDLVKISTRSADPEMAADVVQKLLNIIEDDLRQSMTRIVMEARSRVEEVQLAIDALQGKIQRIEKQIPQTQNRIAELEQQRQKALASEKDQAINFLLFSNEIQNRQIYLNTMQEKRESYMVEEGQKTLELEQLQADLASIEPSKISQQPSISQAPVKPKKTLIVALTFIAAFMASIMLAFAAEFFSRVRRQYIAQPG